MSSRLVFDFNYVVILQLNENELKNQTNIRIYVKNVKTCIMINRVKYQRYILKYDFELELRLTETNSVLTRLLVLKLFLLPLQRLLVVIGEKEVVETTGALSTLNYWVLRKSR